jgi:hypothetical protein
MKHYICKSIKVRTAVLLYLVTPVTPVTPASIESNVGHRHVNTIRLFDVVLTVHRR